MDKYILGLVNYAVEKELIEEDDKIWAANRILEIMQIDSIDFSEKAADLPLHEILEKLVDYAVLKGFVEDNTMAKDLFDTKLMGALVPMPHDIRRNFSKLYKENPKKATDWFYHFSQNTNYIRNDRIAKDVKWVYKSKYGPLDITINLSKPEKDPKAIAAAKSAPQSGYPKCQLCTENEGYSGRINHPARQNHRIIPLTINNSLWYLQYSPYVYYNEHCIVFNSEHTPMKVDKTAFRKLLDFVELFPHYFVGSNADLPIVGGSILSHDHFQGGNYTFAMAKAEIEEELFFRGYEDVKAGIIKWPMSVIRISSKETQKLVDLADIILSAWRNYTDKDAFIYAETDGEPHNTITPIARKKGDFYELDLVLRNNITTKDHPLGVYHPHANLHHIKKENIGLIEVMGLAVLPSRLKTELAMLKDTILCGEDIKNNEILSKHADWISKLKEKYIFTEENTENILKQEVGAIFEEVLEDAGVYKRTSDGKAAFLRFAEYLNREILL